MKKIFTKRQFKFNFMGQRKLGYLFSVVLLIISVASLSIRGLNYGIDFEGGILVEASSETPVDMKEVREKLSFLRDLAIQSAGTEGKTILIQAKPEASENANDLVARIKVVLGAGYTYDQVEVVGPTIGKIIDVFGDYRYTLLIGAGFTLAGILLLYKMLCGYNYYGGDKNYQAPIPK